MSSLTFATQSYCLTFAIVHSDWEFFSAPDPTHGNVNYQTRADAIKKGLAYVQKDGTTVLKVDDTTVVPVGGNRDS
jgi:hypothetical protein